jgi:hypothetical protein
MAQHNPSQEQIRVRAYEIFLRRGGSPGSPESDWLLAESELREETASEDLDDVRPLPSASRDAGPPKRSVRTVRSTTASKRSG